MLLSSCRRMLQSVALAAIAPAIAHAAPSNYTYVDLGTLGGTSSDAFAINNSGHIVGWSFSPTVAESRDYNWRTGQWTVSTYPTQMRNAFVYDHGQMINLGRPGEGSIARGINDSNRIVGSVGNDDHNTRAFRLKYGPMNETGNINSFIDSEVVGNYAWGINNNNQTVVNNARNFGSFAFVYEKNTASNVGPLLGAPAALRAINNNGLVVGSSYVSADSSSAIHAIVYDTQTHQTTDLGTLATKPTGTNSGGVYNMLSHGWDINDSNQVVGCSYVDTPDGQYPDQHPFLWENGTMTDLGMLPGTMYGTAMAINNRSQIVGNSGRYAFLYTDGVMYNLNDLANVPDGWTISIARDINDSGQIVGYATLDSSYGGITHAFLLDPTGTYSPLMSSLETESEFLPYAGTFSAAFLDHPLLEPVPEPTGALVLSGISGLLLCRRYRPAARR